MSILNVNKINPVGGGSTITIAGIASVTNNISVGNSVTAGSFVGPIEGAVTGNVTGNADTASGLSGNPSINTTGIVTATSFVPSQGQLSHRNIIINGAMTVAQRGVSSTTNGYGSVDRFQCSFSATDESPTHTQHTLTSSDTGPYAEGFRKSFHVQNGNQTGGAGASDFIRLWHKIEAQDLANSGWNYTSSSSYITLSFWVKSSVAQTYYVQMRTGDGTSKMYYFAMNLSANTWTKVTHSIPGHADLTFDSDNGEGIYFAWYTFRGTNNTGTVTANQWNNYSGSTLTPDQTTTWYTTNDATYELTGVQLEVGPVATPFEHKSLQDEFHRCCRYYQKYGSPGNGNTFQALRPVGHSGGTVEVMTDFRGIPMRSAPTLASSGTLNIRGCASSYADNAVTLTSNNFLPSSDGISYTGHFWVSAASGSPFVGCQAGRVTGATNGAYIEFKAEL